MKSTSLRRMTARVAVAGAIALIPLAAVTIPASADVPLDNAPTDVAWPHHGGGNPWWDNDRDDWHHHRDHDDWNRGNDWNRGGWWNNNDDCWWRNALPSTGSW
ncbi:hypothetical protein VMT65_16185 [Nocardia sp. CDC153]|uniref:hypothetical protein n=1 Tax=Nocardia sp. CDC153 TaxID=3112167 RepID=UPI002DB59527|nr:hypothetical protein [Nocardia sp. CDC153]MEC3954579.1 hypothetical protein [Nocardia sp. CDC153]